MRSTRGPVLLVAHAFLPDAVAGTELHVYHLARHLQSRWPVHVFHAGRDVSRAQVSVVPGEVDGIPVTRLVQNYPYQGLEAARDGGIDRAFEAVLDRVRPSVVHFHHLAHLSLGLPERARARGLPTLMTLHDYHLICPAGGQLAAHPDGRLCEAPEPARCAACHAAWRHREGALERLALGLGRATTPPLPAGWPFRVFGVLPPPMRRLLRRINPPARPGPPPDAAPARARLAHARAAIEALDLVLSPSADLLRRVEATLPLPRTRHLPNGVPDAWAPPGVDTPPPRPPTPPSGPLRLIHVGTLAPHKGIDLLIEAARGLDPATARLDIIGSLDTFPAYTQRLKAELPPAARLLGPRPPSSIQGELATSAALVLAPRWPENAPLTILEARAAGLPVIATDIGGIPELVREGIDGLLVPPNDAAALATALRRFCADPALRRRLAAGVRPPLTAAAHATQVEALYRALGAAP